MFLTSSAKNFRNCGGVFIFPVAMLSLFRNVERLGKSLLVSVQSSQNSDLVSRTHFRSFVYPAYFVRSERAFVKDTRTLSLCRLPTICRVKVWSGKVQEESLS